MSRTQELVRTACLAPSVHNSQPWSWRIVTEARVELYADRSRQLRHTDPEGRELVMSCGAALHHLSVAARAFGFETDVDLDPRPTAQDLLARVDLRPAEITEEAVERLAALEDRTSDRRGFATWEVPMTRLDRLAEAARSWGAHVRVIHEPDDVTRTADLLERARRHLLSSADLDQEQAAWLDRGTADGVPARHAVPPRDEHDRRPATRFDRWTVAPTTEPVEDEEPGRMLALLTAADDEPSWLRCGMALSAVWLEATRQGLSVVPQTHVTEDPDLRRELRRVVLDDLGWPQAVLRVGWPSTRQQPAARTPRRSLDDVVRT